MHGRVYKKGNRWEVRWQFVRNFATEAEAELAAEGPPPAARGRVTTPREIAEFALRLHESGGISWASIATGLSEAGVPTPYGGPTWSGSTLSSAAARLRRERDARDERARTEEWST